MILFNFNRKSRFVKLARVQPPASRFLRFF
jgi:hypothetical protein